MSIMLSRYLKDFGEPESPPPMIEVGDFLNDDISSPFADMPEQEEVDVEAERREAYAEGHSAATTELTEKYELEAQATATAHLSEIEDLKLRYEVEAATVIASRLQDIAEEVARIVSAAAAAALAPVMTDVLTEKAVLDLATLLRQTILDGDAGQIVVRGPASLFEILRTELGEHAASVRHLETDDIDLAVDIGESVLVTRMSAWAASLKKVLE